MLNIRSQYVVVALITAAVFLFHRSGGRELRPSDHGLSFQEDSLPPTQSADGQEMRSFFDSSSIPLPEAKNISDAWISVNGDSRSLDSRRVHVKVGLLLASAVCGLTGVLLLAVSGVIFLFRLHNRETKPSAGAKIESSPAPATLPHAAIVEQ